MTSDLKDLIEALINRCELAGLTERGCYVIEVERWEVNRLREAIDDSEEPEPYVYTGKSLSSREIEQASRGEVGDALQSAMEQPSSIMEAFKR